MNSTIPRNLPEVGVNDISPGGESVWPHRDSQVSAMGGRFLTL